MADADNEIFDDLDAFFNAASGDNPEVLQQAAQNVAAPPPTKAERETAASQDTKASRRRRPKQEKAASGAAPTATSMPGDDSLDGKFIAIDPEAYGEDGHGSDEPFILIPANIHTFLPWWGWLTIASGLVVLVAGVLVASYVHLNSLTTRLGDSNEANAQYAMRQLVIRGDERTVNKLYDMAASRRTEMTARLRAVDTLGLIGMPQADRALLRLELAGGTDEVVREAAIAARKQREAARARGRQ